MGNPHYYAMKGDLEKHPLATDAAADRMLLAGYNIVMILDNSETVVATPENGWIGQRPTIVRKYYGNSSDE